MFSANRCFKRLLSVSVVLLILASTFVNVTSAQTPKLQDKALSFLSDVIELDLAKYKVELDPQYSHDEHFFFKLYPVNPVFLDSNDYGDAVLNFYNGTLESCNIFPGLTGLHYIHPDTDRFNRTLGIFERYQVWAGGDSQVGEMANMLRSVGSEKNVTQVSGNLSLKISVDSSLSTYKFSNRFNGVDYSGVSVAFGNKIGDLFFDNSQAYYKIGDTSVNVSKEQAIRIAMDFLKTYSINRTFSNGTTITITDLNVTGVFSTILQSTVRENSTLYPQWNIQLNIGNMPAPGLQGVGIWIWANDGTVKGAYQYARPMNFEPFIDMLFFPIILTALTPLFLFLGFAVVLIIIIVSLLRRNKTPQAANK